MLITCTCPNDVNSTRAVFSNNNNFLALFNEDLKVPPYSKICVHSAYISYAPEITITTGLNNTVDFEVVDAAGNAYTDQAILTAGSYTPQQLAKEVQYQMNLLFDANTDEFNVEVDWDVISGTFQFHIFVHQPSAGAVSADRQFLLLWSQTVTSFNLGRIMGFVGGAEPAIPSGAYTYGTFIVFNDTIPEMMTTIEGDYSINYNTNANSTPVAYISIENINSKSWNNYSQQALKFLEVLRYTYPQNLNNAFILPYEKSWIYLMNDSEILLNSLEVTIRNLDGSLMPNLDTSKQVIIVFETVPDIDYAIKMEQLKSITSQNRQLKEMEDMMALLQD